MVVAVVAVVVAVVAVLVAVVAAVVAVVEGCKQAEFRRKRCRWRRGGREEAG